MNVKPRNVSLTPENDSFITAKVASGRFANASEVVRAALRLLVDEERRLDVLAGRAAHPKPDSSPADGAGS